MDLRKYSIFILVHAFLFWGYQASASSAASASEASSSSSSSRKNSSSPGPELDNPAAQLKKKHKCALQCVTEIKKVKKDLKEKAHAMIAAATTHDQYKTRVLDYECGKSHLQWGINEVGIKQRARCLAKSVLQKMIEKAAKEGKPGQTFNFDPEWYKKTLHAEVNRYVIPIHHHPPAQPKKVGLLSALPVSSSAKISASMQKLRSPDELYARPQSRFGFVRLDSSHGRDVPASVLNKFDKE